MAVTGWPTEAAEGQVATEVRWRKMARLWCPEGVADGVLNEMAPSLDAGQVTVATGAAWIDGHYAENDAPVIIPIGGDGLVVLRYTYAGSLFEVAFRAGATTPIQDATTYEIVLASVTGGVLTDRRALVSGGGPRGWVGYARRETDTSNVGGDSETIIGSFSADFVAVAGRRYKVTVNMNMSRGAGTPAFGFARVHIIVPDSIIGEMILETPAGYTTQLARTMIFDGGVQATPGPNAIRVGIMSSGGTGTANRVFAGTSSASRPITTLVEDIGAIP